MLDQAVTLPPMCDFTRSRSNCACATITWTQTITGISHISFHPEDPNYPLQSDSVLCEQIQPPQVFGVKQNQLVNLEFN